MNLPRPSTPLSSDSTFQQKGASDEQQSRLDGEYIIMDQNHGSNAGGSDGGANHKLTTNEQQSRVDGEYIIMDQNVGPNPSGSEGSANVNAVEASDVDQQLAAGSTNHSFASSHG